MINGIKIFTTGGTIDKIYFDAKSKYEIGPPNIRQVLAEFALSADYSIESIMKKDSLELDDADRDLILSKVESCEENRVIITHGTDTMVKTARCLSSVKNKTIVLTGSLQPALFKNSDALFNIGCAFAAVQSLPEGVYITMNGKVFSHDNVRKNLDKNQFEEE